MQEQIHISRLRARLAAVGAVAAPARSTRAKLVFWVPASRKWLSVVRRGDTAWLTYSCNC